MLLASWLAQLLVPDDVDASSCSTCPSEGLHRQTAFAPA